MTIPLEQAVQKWSRKKLESELKSVREQIINSSYGKWELRYEALLVRELDRRYPL